MTRYKVRLGASGVLYDAWIEKVCYQSNKAACLKLVDEEGIVAVATVNLEGVELAPEEVCIKDWSENTGMLSELIRHGIVEDTGRRIPTGFVEAAVCRLKV